MTSPCPTTDCMINPGSGSGVWDVLLSPPGEAWVAAGVLALLLCVGVAWGLRRDGLDRATRRRVLENLAVVFAAVVLTGSATVVGPIWLAAVVGGPGGYLVGTRAVAALSRSGADGGSTPPAGHGGSP